MARSDFKFHVSKRVRYAEIDAQAVVFNSRYLEFVASSQSLKKLHVAVIRNAYQVEKRRIPT